MCTRFNSLLLMLFLLIGGVHAADKEVGWKTVESKFMEMKISYPPGWDIWGVAEGEPFEPNYATARAIKSCLVEGHEDCGTVYFGAFDATKEKMARIKQIGFQAYVKEMYGWESKESKLVLFEEKKMKNGTWFCATVKNGLKSDRKISIWCQSLHTLHDGRTKLVKGHFEQQDRRVALAMKGDQEQVKKIPEYIASKDIHQGIDWSDVPVNVSDPEKLTLKNIFYEILERIEILDQKAPKKGLTPPISQ